MLKYLDDRNCSPFIIHIALLKHYGAEYLNFDPATIKSDFPKWDPLIYDKIQAISTLLTTDCFYNDLQSFTVVIRCFNDLDPSFELLIPLEPQQIAWGNKLAKLLDDDYDMSKKNLHYIQICKMYYGAPDNDQEFTKEINDYINNRIKEINVVLKENNLKTI